MNTKVDAFISNADNWQAEYQAFREIALASGLDEAFKWGKPCYTYNGDNVLIIQGFKHFCALLFPKGALLKDPHGILEWPGQNTQSAKRACFKDAAAIRRQAAVLKACVAEAIEAEKAGLRVEFKKADQFAVPDELQTRLDSDPALKEAFEALTPGRQRGYLLHFSGAKQSKTRAARVEKHRDRILDGLGLND